MKKKPTSAAAVEKPEKCRSVNPGFQSIATKVRTGKSKHLNPSSIATTNQRENSSNMGLRRSVAVKFKEGGAQPLKKGHSIKKSMRESY